MTIKLTPILIVDVLLILVSTFITGVTYGTKRTMASYDPAIASAQANFDNLAAVQARLDQAIRRCLATLQVK